MKVMAQSLGVLSLGAQLCQAEESLTAPSLPPQAWSSAGTSASQPPSSAWGIPSQPPAPSARTAAAWTRNRTLYGSWKQSFSPGRGSSTCRMGPCSPPSPCPTSTALGPFSPAACTGATACRSWTRLSYRQAVSPCSHPPTLPPMPSCQLFFLKLLLKKHFKGTISCHLPYQWVVLFSPILQMGKPRLGEGK